jgi:hypothetical protein
MNKLSRYFATSDFFIVFFWFIPVFFNVLKLNQNFVLVSTYFAALFSILLVVKNNLYLLITLPFFALLSPIIGYLNIFGIKILLSDLFFVFVLFIFLLKSDNYYKFNRKSYANSFQFVFIFLLFIFSILISYLLNILINMKSFLYAIEFAFIYFYTKKYITNTSIFTRFINSWIISILLSSIILIQAYISGLNLSSVLNDTNVELIDKENITYLFQASYYYTGFHYLLGISIIITLLNFFFNQIIFIKFINLFSSFILFISLGLMSNKTAIFSVFLSIFIIIIIHVILNFNKYKYIFIFFTIFLFFLIFLTINFSNNDFTQSAIYISRLNSNSSFITRIGVYIGALINWVKFPLNLFVGMGPNFLDGSGNQNIIQPFTTSIFSGMSENTIDSGWLSYLIELGLFSFLLLINIFYLSIKRTFVKLKDNILFNRNNTGLIIFASLIFLALALTTQMLGYSKTSWLPFQLLVIGFNFKKYYNNF